MGGILGCCGERDRGDPVITPLAPRQILTKREKEDFRKALLAEVDPSIVRQQVKEEDLLELDAYKRVMALMN